MNKKRSVSVKPRTKGGVSGLAAVPPGVRASAGPELRLSNPGAALVVPDFESIGAIADFVTALNKAFSRKPRTLTLRFIGTHNLQCDAALLLFEMIRHRECATTVITEAWSALLGPSILPWLAGDIRRIRSSTYFYFRSLAGVLGHDGGVTDFQDRPGSDLDPESIALQLGAVDYEQFLKHMNEYLPVGEWAGKVIRPAMLKEFGLIGPDPWQDVLFATGTSSGGTRRRRTQGDNGSRTRPEGS